MQDDRLLTTSFQLRGSQFDIVENISNMETKKQKRKVSKSEIMRNAFDFYINNEYPQFAEN